jgi:hypothetical protein
MGGVCRAMAPRGSAHRSGRSARVVPLSIKGVGIRAARLPGLERRPDGQVRPTRACRGRGSTPSSPGPGWEPPTRARDPRHRVLQHQLMSSIVMALQEGDCNVVATIGPQGDPAAVDPGTSNVLITRWLPQDAVIERAAVVVSHAGAGTITGCLSRGVPVVCLPPGRPVPPRPSGRAARPGVALPVDRRKPADIRQPSSASSSIRPIAPLRRNWRQKQPDFPTRRRGDRPRRARRRHYHLTGQRTSTVGVLVPCRAPPASSSPTRSPGKGRAASDTDQATEHRSPKMKSCGPQCEFSAGGVDGGADDAEAGSRVAGPTTDTVWR